jgi:gamma-glutamyltranspeptidase/glutathione hydrolase
MAAIPIRRIALSGIGFSRGVAGRLEAGTAAWLVCCAALMTLWGAPLDAQAASRSPGLGREGMVVSSSSHAARAGAEMLEIGGNAIDAAVATAFAVGVTQPFSAGIGGGAFILVRLANGELIALDARETAPAAATRDMYLQPGLPEHPSVQGPLAVATPGMVAGLALVQKEHGTLPLSRVLEPAIRLAAAGFPLGSYQAGMAEYMRGRLTADRFPETARIQFPTGGNPVEPGTLLVQKDLAKTLAAIAEKGPEVFYTGEIARRMVDEVGRRGGILSAADLAAYRPVKRSAVSGTYRGIEVHSFPPPSSGGIVLLEMLNILEGFDLGARGAGSSPSIHLIAEAMKLAFADRAAYMGDSDFVDVPRERLVSKEYGQAQRARINPGSFVAAPWSWQCDDVALDVIGPGLSNNDSGTTHLSVTDKHGNAVAITATINTPYGSGITVPGTGIVLNNEMDDFAVAPDTPNAYGLVDTRGANAIAPGKRPLSSMTPTILVKDGKTFMVTGSPGGPRIITTVLLTILNVVDYGMNVQQAVSAPRFHHQWVPDKLRVEPAIPGDVVAGLEGCGHRVDRSSRNWSAAEAIVIDAARGWHQGGSDPRTDGLAAGVPAP